MAFFIATATFLLFSPAIGYQFINFDDGLYVYENPHVLGGLGASGAAYACTTFDVGNWMPLTWLSLMLDTVIYGTRPAGYHLTSLLLHALSAAFLFLALQRMTKCFWQSALVAAIFAFHPLRQESVVWVAERKDTLSTFFGTLGLLAYGRFAERPGIGRYSLVILCLCLSLASKSMLVTLPCLLLLLDFWPLNRMGNTWLEFRARFPRLLLEKLPMLGICLAMIAITYEAQNHVGAVSHAPATLFQIMLRVGDNYIFYLRQFFWPGDLAILYAKNAVATPLGMACLATLTAISLVAVRALSRTPWLAVGWFWFLGALVPVIGLIHLGQIYVADRYTYFPSIGLAIAIAWTLGWLAERFPRLRFWMLGAGLAFCMALAATNGVTLQRWADPISLFTDSIRISPHPAACNNVAGALISSGDIPAAIHYATLGISLNPNTPGPFNTRGLAHNSAGDYDAALQDYSEAIARDPEFAEAWNNRGNTWLNRGQLESALADFQQAAKLKPDFAEAWNNGSFIWYSRSNYSEALDWCNRALALKPGNPSAFHNRALIHIATGEYEKAWDDVRQARALGREPSPETMEVLRAATGRTD